MKKMESIINTIIIAAIATVIIAAVGYLVYLPILKSQVEDIKEAEAVTPSPMSSDIAQLASGKFR